jgi:hypothetical protein
MIIKISLLSVYYFILTESLSAKRKQLLVIISEHLYIYTYIFVAGSGYPTVVGPDGGDKKKGSRRAKTSKRGEPSFIEGWYICRRACLRSIKT